MELRYVIAMSVRLKTSAAPGIGLARRSIASCAARGFRNRCPNCGRGALLASFLRPHEECASCHEPNGRIMAHDAPPYITILIVGHVIVPLIVLLEKLAPPPLWVQYAIWLPASLLLSLMLLPRIKGAWIGMMWALRLDGNEFQ
jgi:uncharacterized protein (DUF983 family)